VEHNLNNPVFYLSYFSFCGYQGEKKTLVCHFSGGSQL
jgi:hypothetical protein